MTYFEQTLRDWLRAGVTPSIPRDRADEESTTLSECNIFRRDAPRPDWRTLQEVESWLSTPGAVPVVGRVVADALNGAGASLKSFNTEFERRIDEYRVPYIDEGGLHMPLSHLQMVQLAVALEAAAAILHRQVAA